jgi:aspartate/methionine/tyrosine aminotransferase
VTVNGLSKTFAMTGWRIGYFAGQGEFGLKLADGVKKLQGQSTTSIPTFLMDAIPVALESCGEEAEAMRVAFAERAQLMYQGVSAMPGVVCPLPTGAMYLFPDVSAHFGKTSAGGAKIGSAMDFATALLEEHKVAVVPGEDFGTGGENCIRLTFACSNAQISEGVARIGAFIASLR